MGAPSKKDQAKLVFDTYHRRFMLERERDGISHDTFVNGYLIALIVCVTLIILFVPLATWKTQQNSDPAKQ